MDLQNLTVERLHEGYRSREVSVSEVTKACLDRIETANPALGAFHEIASESALARSRELDSSGFPDAPGPLWGVPVALKDNMCATGFKVSCGSRILENFRAPYDSTVAARLKAAGAILMGSCHMDEFAMGSSSETNAFARVCNPYDLSRVPGGSSGGSAAAVAAGLVPLSLGSDTGGSIRQPAAFCGVVGMKPTYGRVSRFGLVAFASSLDQIGPFAGCVTDAARLLGVIAGHEARDTTSIPDAVPDFTRDLGQTLEGRTIGLPREYFQEGVQPEVMDRIEASRRLLESLGARIIDVSLPHTEYAIPAYYILATAEASANLARFDGVRYGRRAAHTPTLDDVFVASRSEGFGMEVKRRIITGTFVLSSGYYDAYYLKAQKVRSRIRDDFKNAFEKVDVLLTPTSPITAFEFGEKQADPISMYLSDIFTVSVNLAGLPALSLPCGNDGKGLPVGLQFIAPWLEENRLFQFAARFEEAMGYAPPELKV